MRTLVTGARGFLGKHLVLELSKRGHEVIMSSSSQCNLLDPHATIQLLASSNPDCMVHLAATVGGIGANRKEPGRFIYENLMMGLNVLEAVRFRNTIKPVKLVQIGTVCGYPKHTPVPFKEEDLWNGYPEETNAPYGIAKRTLIQAGISYRLQYGVKVTSLIPTNLYGPGDSMDLEKNHVIPALIRKCLEAKANGSETILVWGTGGATRDFLYVTDCAKGIANAVESDYDLQSPINLGAGVEISIQWLLEIIMKATGFQGRVAWDHAKPDGQPRRHLDITKAEEFLNWKPEMPFDEGIALTVEDMRQRLAQSRPT